jgi:hypothetical protein
MRLLLLWPCLSVSPYIGYYILTLESSFFYLKSKVNFDLPPFHVPPVVVFRDRIVILFDTSVIWGARVLLAAGVFELTLLGE